MSSFDGGALPLEIATEGGAVSTVDEQVQVLAAHMTARETATLQSEVDTLRAALETATAERDALATQVDTLTVERDAAVAEFATFQADLEAATAREVILAERTEALRAVAPQLLEGEQATERMERLVTMEQASFDDYLATLTLVAGATSRDDSFDENKGESANAKGRNPGTDTPDSKALSRTVLQIGA